MKLKEFQPSAYYLVRSNPSFRDVVVTCSALNIPRGKFLNSKVLLDFPANQVFLNCPDNQWYLDGVPGLGDDVFKTAEQLKKICDELKQPDGKVIFWGGSMGGYGALLLGCLVEADIVICICAEIILNIESGYSQPHLKGRQPSFDFAKIVNRSETICYMYYAEHPIVDVMSAVEARKLLHRKGIIFKTVPGLSHSIAGYLKRYYGIPNILSALLRDGKFELSAHDDGNFLEYEDLIRLLYRASIAARGSDTGKAERSLSELNSIDLQRIPDRYLSYYYYNRSKLFLKLEDNAGALSDAKKAVQLEPHYFWNALALAKAYLAAGDAHRAIAYAQYGVSKMEPQSIQVDWSGYLILSEAQKKVGKPLDAIATIELLLKYDPPINYEKKGWERLAEIYADLSVRAKKQDRDILR